MATIKLGSFVTDIRGSIGGTIYSRNANASYAKNFTKPTNPDTTAQQVVRGIFSQIAQAWRSLTDSERESWITAAALSEFSYTNKVGENSFYTGSQLYMKLNGNLLQANPTATPFTTAPSPISLTAIFLGAVVADSVGQSVEITINGGVNLPAGQEVKVYSTGPVSAGVYRPKGSMFKLIGSFPTVAAGQPNILATSSSYLAKFGPLVAGNSVWFKLETYAPATGQTIPGVQEKVIVT